MTTDNQLPDDDNAVVTSVSVQRMNHHNVHRCPEDSSARRPRRRYVWIAVVMAVVIASVASFLLGFCCGDRVQTRREVEQEWQRLFSILQWGLQEGKVDASWIQEIEIIKHESEWKD